MTELNISEFPVRVDRRPRPENVPEGWVVFNGYSPLWGSPLTTGPDPVLHLWWRDRSGPRGIFCPYWAAVDPAHPQAVDYVLRNSRLIHSRDTAVIEYHDSPPAGHIQLSRSAGGTMIEINLTIERETPDPDDKLVNIICTDGSPMMDTDERDRMMTAVTRSVENMQARTGAAPLILTVSRPVDDMQAGGIRIKAEFGIWPEHALLSFREMLFCMIEDLSAYPLPGGIS